MHRPSTTCAPRKRRAIILLVVLALLTLFAVVGLTFVLYAQSQARASLYFREGRFQPQPGDVPIEPLANYFLGQLLYDAPDDSSGLYSGLRGHSLARLLYGLNEEGSNATPFNGVGRLHATSPLPGVDDYHLVNYTHFPQDGFLRDPERLGWRAGPDRPRGPYAGGFNVPYTYPDLNNLFLAAVRADGTVLVPSFHRPWLFNPTHALNDPSNPNWHGAAGKYLTLRPRPADMGPGFPYPEDATGDVKNFPGPGGNDSLWIDLDFPVLSVPDGRRFKPLFAPLVVDLDGRVNLNAHGNVRGRDAQGRPAHASNQGWGPWEVNLAHVLGRPAGVLSQESPGPEWPNLFLGRTGAARLGRYGPDRMPGRAGDRVVFGPPLHASAQGDLDACQLLGGELVPTLAPAALPGARRPLASFPAFPDGYDNGSSGQPQAEGWEHPALAGVERPAGDDRPFLAAELAGLLLSPRSGAPTSALEQLCPVNFADARSRRLVTTHSFDPDAPGAGPWVYDPGQSGYAVSASAPDRAPSGPPLPFPPLALRSQPVPADSDFGTPGLPATAPAVDWRGRTAALGRLNLARRLTAYPLPSPQTPDTCNRRFDLTAHAGQFLQAQQERQQLADEVYVRLLAVTGVRRPGSDPARPTAAELQVRRWLAQLAANVVDFLDEDDVSTPFNFYTHVDAEFQPFDVGEKTGGDPELPLYWVFGTELPHLVLSEALVEYLDAPPADPPAPTTVRAWVELFNPFEAPPAGRGLQPQGGFPVPLRADQVTGSVAGKDEAYAPFQVVLATGMADRPRNDNVLGRPADVRAATADADFAGKATLADGSEQPGPFPSVKPQGFFLLGPGADARGTLAPPPRGSVPPDTPVLQTTRLEYRRAFAADKPEERDKGLTVLLRRLANPHLPNDPQPSVKDPGTGERVANPWYNPYLTVDVMGGVPLRDAAGQATYAARGKRQPYAAHPDQHADQKAADAQQKTQHTFGLPADPGPAAGRHDWLVHLDRLPVSPAELLHVSACQPHQLTQRFWEGGEDKPGQKFRHRAPWFDQRCRLYRLFELLTVGNRVGPGPPAPRLAGKINLNTVWGPETFLALCDPQPANGPGLTRDAVLAAYARMLALRTPGGRPGPGDRPFLGLATGHALPDGPGNPDPQRPGRGSGINDTLLRAADRDADALPGGGDGSPRLFEVQGEEHPYRRFELLNKIFNHATTRSNVFAVWVTVGFFEVTDETARPVKLGPEVGRAEGRHVRRAFFAIVDRTAMPVNPRPAVDFRARDEPALLHLEYLY